MFGEYGASKAVGETAVGTGAGREPGEILVNLLELGRRLENVSRRTEALADRISPEPRPVEPDRVGTQPSSLTDITQALHRLTNGIEESMVRVERHI